MSLHIAAVEGCSVRLAVLGVIVLFTFASFHHIAHNIYHSPQRSLHSRALVQTGIGIDTAPIAQW